MGGKSASAASFGSIKASAEFVVPRSMPMFMRIALGCRGAFAHVEFELPAPSVRRYAPELQHSGFGHFTFDRHRNHFFARSIGVRRQEDLDRRELFDFVANFFDQRTRRVALAR